MQTERDARAMEKAISKQRSQEVKQATPKGECHWSIYSTT
jgi:hypothetical protein